MDALKYFADIARAQMNPEIQAWKKNGGLVIGTTCSNIPEEVLFAAGALPLRLRAPGLQDTSNADSRLHRINCSYVRSVLELALRGELDFLDGLVTTNSCDHMLRLSGELQEKPGLPFVHYFSMYHSLGKSAQEWFVNETRQMLHALNQQFSRPVTERELGQAITTYNKSRRLMQRINELRRSDPPPLTGAEYMSIVLTGMSIPRELFNEKLEALIPALEQRQAVPAKLPRLMLMGGACDLPDFVDFIERKGAVVVADSLCFGSRHYEGVIEEDDADAIQAIARRYTARIACPSIMNGFEHNIELYRKAVKDYRVNGLVCARLKFCDHWAGARKMIGDDFRTENLPLLDLEREYATSGSGQISTRVQAFLEMLKE